MIVAEAARLRQQYTRLADAESVKIRVAQIASTREQLEAIEPRIRESVGIFVLIGNRLRVEDRERFDARIEQLAGMIRKSRNEFEQERRQVRRLGETEGMAVSIIRELDTAWRGACDLQVQPFRDLLVLVGRLQVVAAQTQALRGALRDLEKLTEVAPRDASQLAQFDRRLCEVERQAQAFVGLPAAVQEFLRRVTLETATLEDLTPDVVDWLREQGHLGSLAVRFVGGPT